MHLSFEFGKKEKHHIVFQWSHLWASLKVSVDGNKVDREFMRLAAENGAIQRKKRPRAADEFLVILGKEFSLVTDWDFTVGIEEKHKIRIQKKRPRWFSGIRPHTFRVFVDGNEIIHRMGY